MQIELKAPGLTGKKLQRARKAWREQERKRNQEIDQMIRDGCTCEYGGIGGGSWDPYCPLHRRDRPIPDDRR